jgi:hypothetical protein
MKPNNLIQAEAASRLGFRGYGQGCKLSALPVVIVSFGASHVGSGSCVEGHKNHESCEAKTGALLEIAPREFTTPPRIEWISDFAIVPIPPITPHLKVAAGGRWRILVPEF